MKPTKNVGIMVNNSSQMPSCLQEQHQEKTIAVLQFAQTILQDKMAQELFEAVDLEDCLQIASSSFNDNKIIATFIEFVKTPKKYFQLFSKFDYGDVIDVVQNAHSFTHLYYLKQINFFKGDNFQQDYIDFAKENDSVFRQLITFVQLSKFMA